MLVCRQSKVKAHLQSNSWSILVILLSLVTVGCEENKFVQCQEIFQVAQEVKDNNQDVSNVNQQLGEMKSWLEAANEFNQAADRLALLEFNQSELIKYQNQLVTIYRIYSQATYDAVRARENKNLSALKFSRQNAIKAGVIQQKLIREINTYCLKN